MIEIKRSCYERLISGEFCLICLQSDELVTHCNSKVVLFIPTKTFLQSKILVLKGKLIFYIRKQKKERSSEAAFFFLEVFKIIYYYLKLL